jgi:TRAP-type C4-dicarboxylate transport system substrate-binding protein
MMSARNRPGRYAAPAIALAVALTATACAEDSGGESGGGNAGGEALEYGADKQAYIDALADMEPVTLAMQSTAPQGAATGRRFEEYAAAVEDWSGGKITFEITFSNGIAPPPEVDEALADGRLDIGSVIAALDPSKFPANNALWDLSFLGSQQPVEGLLQWHGMMVQSGIESDEIQAEFEDNGMHVLLPAFSSGSYFLDCADEVSDLDAANGKVIASQSRIQNRQAEALGMTPTTVNYAEMFDSLQRNVVDCAMSTLTVSTLGGFIPAAPYFAYDSEVGLASPGGAIAMSLDRWNDLPIPAQQLLYDRIDVLLQANFEATWDNVLAGIEAIEQAGGSINPLADDAVSALEEANEGVLDDAASAEGISDGQAFVDGVVGASEDWAGRVSELGLEGVDVDYDGFPDWYADGAPDLQPYFDELADVMSARRPS